jgi:hypothetical protein
VDDLHIPFVSGFWLQAKNGRAVQTDQTHPVYQHIREYAIMWTAFGASKLRDCFSTRKMRLGWPGYVDLGFAVWGLLEMP